MIWLLMLATVCAVGAVAWAALGIADTQYDDAVHETAQLPRQRDGGDR